MPSLLSTMKRMTRRAPKDPATKSRDIVSKQDVRLDYSITTARLLKAAGENLPFPWLKGAADLVLQVLEPLRLARTNRQDFDSLAQDILETLRLIQDQATTANAQGSSDNRVLEQKCERFAQVLQDMLKDFETIRTDTMKSSAAVWTTPTMQRLIQSYQDRLQKEVLLFNTSNVLDIHASVQRIEQTLTAPPNAVLPPSSQTTHPALENYRSLLAGDLRVIQTNRLAYQDSESHVLHQGEKTWKTFRGENAEERWIEEVKFYHTLRLQPHIRQLFGFTQSQDFLGLVFHEHSLPIHEAWMELVPTQRVLAEAQFYSGWNETLSSLSTDSSFRCFVDHNAFMSVGIDEGGPLVSIGSRLTPQADRSGKMQIVLSSNSRAETPALRYDFRYPSSSLKSGPEWIHKIYNLSLSQWAGHGSLASNISRFYSLVDAIAYSNGHLSPFTTARPSLRVKVSILSREDTLSRFAIHPSRFIRETTRYSSVTYMQFPPQSIPVVWTWYSIPEYITPSGVSGGHRISVPPDVQTILLRGSFATELFDPWVVFTMHHIPTIWRHAQALFPHQRMHPKLEYEYPGYIHVDVQVNFLCPQLNPLFLFTCTELLLSADGSFDSSGLFYLSLDPQGQSRLSESDLSRRGMVFTVGSYSTVHSKTISNVSVQALTEVATEVGKWSDPPLTEFKPSFRGWPKHPRARSSSVDRYLKYPHSRMWHYQHDHLSSPPFHDVLCDLITQEECICSETEKMLLTAGYPTFRYVHDPSYIRERCPCFDADSPARRKRRRAKSVDTACRVAKAISHWIRLMDITEMAQFELRNWYLEPSLFLIHFLGNPPGPNRSGIAPWTVLVQPSQPERGRSRNSREIMSEQ